jgi:hypothetical protein
VENQKTAGFVGVSKKFLILRLYVINVKLQNQSIVNVANQISVFQLASMWKPVIVGFVVFQIAILIGGVIVVTKILPLSRYAANVRQENPKYVIVITLNSIRGRLSISRWSNADHV